MRAKLKNGRREEYCRRHDQIWDSMKQVLKSAEICNYSIWIVDNDIFGYYECEKGRDHAARVQAESETVKLRNEYMKDVMEMELDKETGSQPLMTEVFRFD